MARRDDALGVSGAETVIGAGVVMEGQLESEGDIIIDGTFTGQVTAKGDVSLGVNAQVKANLSGRNVTVAGHLIGDVHAEGEVTLRESGHITGNITCLSLVVNAGGVFLGTSQMEAAPALDRPASSPDELSSSE